MVHRLRLLLHIAAMASAATIACATPGASPTGDPYVLLRVNGLPLPVRDSMLMYDGSRRPLVELQAATLTLQDSATAVFVTTQRDLFAAGMPCEALRQAVRLAAAGQNASAHQESGGSLVAISDTTTTGCEELSTATRTARASVRIASDILQLIIPDSGRTDTVGAITFLGRFYGDSIVLSGTRLADTSVHVPFGKARLLFVRQRGRR